MDIGYRMSSENIKQKNVSILFMHTETRIYTDPMWFDMLEQPESSSISNNARRFSRTTLSIYNLHTNTNIDLRITELFSFFAFLDNHEDNAKTLRTRLMLVLLLLFVMKQEESRMLNKFMQMPMQNFAYITKNVKNTS